MSKHFIHEYDENFLFVRLYWNWNRNSISCRDTFSIRMQFAFSFWSRYGCIDYFLLPWSFIVVIVWSMRRSTIGNCTLAGKTFRKVISYCLSKYDHAFKLRGYGWNDLPDLRFCALVLFFSSESSGSLMLLRCCWRTACGPCGYPTVPSSFPTPVSNEWAWKKSNTNVQRWIITK